MGCETHYYFVFKAELRKEAVKVFQMNSRGYNVMLHIEEEEKEPVSIYEPQYEISNNFDILTSVDSDEPLQPPFKLRNSKWCSVNSSTIIESSSD